MDIQELRQQIDAIDRELTALYCRRMETSRAIECEISKGYII